MTKKCSQCDRQVIQRPGEMPSEFRKRKTCGNHGYGGQEVPTPMLYCAYCGDAIQRHKGEGSAHYMTRKYCSRSCSALAGGTRSARRGAERAGVIIEDVEFLLSVGAPLPDIPRRVGSTTEAALSRYLARHGRNDLARRFHDSNCEECGRSCNGTRCRQCDLDDRGDGWSPRSRSRLLVSRASTVGNRPVYHVGATDGRV